MRSCDTSKSLAARKAIASNGQIPSQLYWNPNLNLNQLSEPRKSDRLSFGPSPEAFGLEPRDPRWWKASRVKKPPLGPARQAAGTMTSQGGRSLGARGVYISRDAVANTMYHVQR